jgi:aminocyclitol acetyltransferase
LCKPLAASACLWDNEQLVGFWSAFWLASLRLPCGYHAIGGLLMEWEYDEILKNNLNGRELVAWGTGDLAIFMSDRVSRDAPIAFYLSKDAQPGQKFMGKDVYPPPLSPNMPANSANGEHCKKPIIDKARHFAVLLLRREYSEVREAMRALGFIENVDYFDCLAKPHITIPTDIEFGEATIGKGSYFAFTPQCIKTFCRSIGRHCSINYSVQVSSNHQMNMIGTGAFYNCFDDADLQEAQNMLTENRANSSGINKVAIGNDVWIGANVFINTSKCSHIGDGAIVGTGAIVLHDVPPYAIVYGAPARVQRYRYTPEQIETLLRVKWWDWDDDTLRANAKLLMHPDKFFEKFGA